MKRGSMAPLILGLLFLFSASAVIGADEVTTRMETRVLESFDGEGVTLHVPHPDTEEYPEGTPVVWRVFGSKFVTEGYPETTFADAYPQGLFGYNVETEEDLKCLGIHVQFNRRGYNAIEIVPGQIQNGEWEARTLDIPGRASTLDFWVWGSNYDYYMEAHLKDPSGQVHVLNMGDLSYVGWKNLIVDIPRQIKQSQQYVPRYQGLSLSKLVIWTRPEEKVDDYYVYIDHIKVLSDMHESLFDGYNLQSPTKMESIWNKEDSEGGSE